MIAAVLPSWNCVWMKLAAAFVSCKPFGHLAYQVFAYSIPSIEPWLFNPISLGSVPSLPNT